jgi:hypothetical protein
MSEAPHGDEYQEFADMKRPEKVRFFCFTNCVRGFCVENKPPSARNTTVGRKGGIGGGANRFTRENGFGFRWAC